MSTGEKNISYTFKHDGQNLFTVRADSPAEFQGYVQAITGSALGADLNAMIEAINNTGALNKVLGATGVDPVQNPEPQQQQPQAPQQEQGGNPWGNAPQGQQWGQPPQQGGNQWGGGQPQQSGSWGGAPQGGGDEAWRADASIQPPHLQPPMTPFGPAKYWGKNKPDGKQSRAWVDPRPYQQVKNLPKEQKFWQWIDDKDL